MLRALAVLLPSRDRLPSNVTDVPTFSELRVHPSLTRLVGLPSSHAPVRDLARVVHDIDVEPRVRIGPLDLRHRAYELDRLLGVEFCGERMVRIARAPRATTASVSAASIILMRDLQQSLRRTTCRRRCSALLFSQTYTTTSSAGASSQFKCLVPRRAERAGVFEGDGGSGDDRNRGAESVP